MFSLLFCAGRAHAQTWEVPIQQLAAKIAAATGPGAVSLDVTNRSSLGKTDVDSVRRALMEQLQASGLRFVAPEQAAATVQVTLSEDLQDYIWVAEIHQGANESAVAMVSVLRPATASVQRETPALTIRKNLMLSTDEQILDIAMINGPSPLMTALFPEQIKLYKLQGATWQEEQSLPVVHAGPWPRDLHGRLVLRQDHLFDAYLPGVVCRSSNGTVLSVACRPSDDPWPVGFQEFSLNAFFAPARNFFTGALSPGIGKKTTAPAFYTAAPLPRGKYTLWLLAGVDGRLHMLDGITDLAAKVDWGSDVATVRSSCGTGWQVLAAGNGAGTTDSLQAFEIPDREPIAIGQAVALPGGVTSLWSQFDGASAAAVVRNAETGKYEAYLLSIGCSQ